MVLFIKGVAGLILYRLRQSGPHMALLVERLAAAALALVLGGSLLVLALPRLFASVLLLPGSVILEIDEPVSESDLDLLIASRERALRWVDAGKIYTDMAIGRMFLVQRRSYETGGGEQAFDRALLNQAITDLRAGLARAPGRPVAWSQLAAAELLAQGPSAKAAAALRMSLITAPYAPLLLFPRIELGFRLWPVLSQETQHMIYWQVRLASRRNLERLARIAIANDRIDIVREGMKLRRMIVDKEGPYIGGLPSVSTPE